MTKPTQKDLEEWGSWLAECTPEDMSREDMQAWQKNKIATRRKLAGLLPPKGPLFKHVTSTPIGPMDARPTSTCLINDLWKNRPGELDDKWLLPIQPATSAGRLTVLETRWPSTYQDWAAALLQVRSYTPEHELERLLLEKELTLSLPQGERLVKRTNQWIASGLAEGEPGNFFLTPNATGGISVVKIRRDSQHWEPYLKGFASEHPCVPGCRLIVANLDERVLHDITQEISDDTSN